MELIITTKEELYQIVKKAVIDALNMQNELNDDSQSDREKYLTIDALMDFLPGRPARQTIYGWVNKRTIPYKKIGSKLYFIQSEIEEWLNNGRKKNDVI